MKYIRKKYHTRSYLRNRYLLYKKLSLNAISKGDATEQYVANIIKLSPDVNNVQVIGNLGGMFDICYEINSSQKEFRALQVKTLSKNKNHIWKATLNSEYLPDTLIVMVNQDRTCFSLIFYGDITTKRTITVNFKKSCINGSSNMEAFKKIKPLSGQAFKKIKPLQIIQQNINIHCNTYTDENEFMLSLHKLLPYSSIFNIDDNLSSKIKKEYDSLQRLQKKCEEHNIPFRRNVTNGDTIDCFINNIPVQCKYITNVNGKYIKSATFKLSTGNTINKRPYSINDPIEYFIFEIGKEYEGNFCCIPKSILIEKGYISTDNQVGKCNIILHPLEYCINKNLWEGKYWNNWNIN